MEKFFEAIEAAATLLNDFPEPFASQRDPDDAHDVNLAIAAQASLIVSRDRDLLDLMDASKADSADFRRLYPNLLILDPVAFLHESADGP